MIFCVCCDLCVFHLVFVVFDGNEEFFTTSTHTKIISRSVFTRDLKPFVDQHDFPLLISYSIDLDHDALLLLQK